MTHSELTWDEARLAGHAASGPAWSPGGTDSGPSSVTAETWFAEPADPATPASGGGSFTVASALDANGAYTDTIRSGWYVFYTCA